MRPNAFRWASFSGVDSPPDLVSMRFTKIGLLAFSLLWPSAGSADVELFDFGINIDGATSCGHGPCDADSLTELSGVAGVDDDGNGAQLEGQ